MENIKVFDVYDEIAKLYEAQSEIEKQELEDMSMIGKEIVAEPEETTVSDGFELKDVACTLYLYGNDLRTLHLNVKGDDFKSVHELLNEMYDMIFSKYDDIAELAISHQEVIDSPSKVLENKAIDWTIQDVQDFTKIEACNIAIEKGKLVLDTIANIKKDPAYESFVYSELDDLSSKLNKYVNYILTQYVK